MDVSPSQISLVSVQQPHRLQAGKLSVWHWRRSAGRTAAGATTGREAVCSQTEQIEQDSQVSRCHLSAFRYLRWQGAWEATDEPHSWQHKWEDKGENNHLHCVPNGLIFFTLHWRHQGHPFWACKKSHSEMRREMGKEALVAILQLALK